MINLAVGLQNLGCALDAKGMNSQILGLQSNHIVHRAGKQREAFAGKTGDEVGVDAFHSAVSCDRESAVKILSRVVTADIGQHMVGQRLCVDTDTCDPVFHHQTHLFGCDGIGTSCLYTVFS